MRVLHVISGIDRENGGPSMALRGLAEAQRRVAGLDVTIVATWQRPTVPAEADDWRARGLRVELIGRATGALSRHPDVRPRVDALVREADVVHVHALWEEIQHQAARAAQRHGRPYLVRPCGGLYPRSLRTGWLKKRLYLAWRLKRNLDRAATIHCTSEAERDELGVGVDAPVVVEPNGVDLSEFTPPPEPGAFRAAHPELAGKPFVLFLGRVHPEKGLELLIPAMARLARADVVLAVAGPDNAGFRAHFERLAEQFDVRPRVLFVGMLGARQRIEALRDATLMCLPSFHENFGIAVVEALAVGTPVVVSDHVGLHPVVSEHGVGGVVPLDASALARELDRWLADDVLRDRASVRAGVLVRERFDWAAIAPRWADHYRAMLKAPEARLRPLTTGP